MAFTVPSTVLNSTHKSLISNIFSLWFMVWSHTFHLSIKLHHLFTSCQCLLLHNVTVHFKTPLYAKSLSCFDAPIRYKYAFLQFFYMYNKKRYHTLFQNSTQFFHKYKKSPSVPRGNTYENFFWVQSQNIKKYFHKKNTLSELWYTKCVYVQIKFYS